MKTDFNAYYNIYQEIVPHLTDHTQNLVAQLFSKLVVVNPQLANFVNELTSSQLIEKDTISKYNNLSLALKCADIKVDNFSEPVPLLLLYPNPFMFIVFLFPNWINTLESIGITRDKILRSTEYFNMKKWFFTTLGTLMRQFCEAKLNTAIVNCFKSIVSMNDTSALNELISVVRHNTNIYDTAQLKSLLKLFINEKIN